MRCLVERPGGPGDQVPPRELGLYSADQGIFHPPRVF